MESGCLLLASSNTIGGGELCSLYTNTMRLEGLEVLDEVDEGEVAV